MDLSEEEITLGAASVFPAASDGKLQLDFSGCIVDYKATSVLIDAALTSLQNGPTPRQLILVFNIKFQERLFFKWFFFGTNLAPDVPTAPDDEIRARALAALESLQVALEIRIVDPQSKETLHVFCYA